MKKIISVFLLCIIVFGTLPLSLSAEESAISITSPQDGAVISSLDSINADINVAAEYVIIRFDGVEIENAVPTDGKISVQLDEKLSVGCHSVDVIAVGDGISAIASSNFKVNHPYEVKIYDETMENAPQIENVNVQTAGEVTTGSIASYDGTKALAFNVPVGVTTKGKAFVTLGGTYSGPAVIEVDVFFGTSLNMKIETKNKKGGWGSMFRSEIGQYVFDRSGNIMSGDGTKIGKGYVTKEWSRLRIEGDFSKGICSLSIGKYDSEGNVNFEPIFVDEPLGEAFIDVIQIRFEFASLTYFTDYADQKVIGIDNLNVIQNKEVTGLSDASSPNHSDFTSEEENVVPADISTVRVKGASQFRVADFMPYISAYVDGKEINVASAIVDEDNLDITFEKTIGEEKTVEIVLSEDILIMANTPLGVPVKYTFKTDTPSVCISKISYKKNSTELYSPQQITPGELECVFGLKNISDEAKNVLLVAAVYKDNEMIDFSYLPYEIPTGNSEKSVMINLPAEYNNTDYSIELFAIDSFAESKPLSKMWRISK